MKLTLKYLIAMTAYLIVLTALLSVLTLNAQVAPPTLNGQSFLITTNVDGKWVITSTGPAGTLSTTPASTVQQALQQAGQIVSQNNPANAGYYGTNEMVVRVGAMYLQNSGQSVIEIGVEKYGLIASNPNIGFGAALFQGNKSGQSATAGGAAFADYRRVIGDVSASFGGGAGYDAWNKAPMILAKVDLEYRQNAHLSEFLRLGYAFEPTAPSSVTDRGGLIVGGGVNYAF